MCIMAGDIILSVNSGSSSLKVTAYRADSASKQPVAIASAQIKNLTSPPVKLKATNASDEPIEEDVDGIDSQEDAFRRIVDHLLRDKGPSDLKKETDVKYVAHRIVHGGDSESPRVVDDETVEYLEELSDLAPL